MSSTRNHAKNRPSTLKRLAAASALTAGIGAASVVVAPTASAAPDWDKLAQCESSGNWSINTGNGFSGGLQFTPSTWKAFGGQGSAHNASRAEQIAVAERVLAVQGAGAWPGCTKKTNWLNGGPGTPSAKVQKAAEAPKKKKASVVTPKKKATPAPAAASAPQGKGTYTVVAGDTLSKIAARNCSTWQRLFKLNSGEIADPNVIYPDQVIKV